MISMLDLHYLKIPIHTKISGYEKNDQSIALLMMRLMYSATISLIPYLISKEVPF
jgi:hypothetical protein